jgi:hypothetical protein
MLPPPRQRISTSHSRRAGRVEHRGDFFRGACPLDWHRIDDHRHMRGAALQRGQHVAHRGGLQRGHHADHTRMIRNGAFALSIEQTCLRQFFLEPQERLVEIPSPARRMASTPSCSSPRASYIDTSARTSTASFAWREVDMLIASAKHHATNLRACVLEREIPMPAGRPREIRDLSPTQASGKLRSSTPAMA